MAGNEEDQAAYEQEVKDVQARYLPRERVEQYFGTFGAAMDWAGMRRWVEKQRGREGERP